MDRAYIQANDIVRRYLNGTLSEDESRVFESACASDPSLADDLNCDWQLKAGLEELHAKGELVALVRPARRYFETPAFSLAASVLAAIGISSAAFLSLQLYQAHSEVELLGARVRALDAPKVLAQTFRVLPTRSGRLELEIPAEGWVGFLVEVGDLGAQQVNVEFRNADGRRLLQQTAVFSDDGTLMLTVDARKLVPGPYDLILQSRPDPATERRIGLSLSKLQ